MDLKEALETALAHERALRADRDEIDKQLADLEVEVRGLRMAVERYSHGAADEEPATIPVPAEEFFDAPRTEAIALVLGSVTVPMSPTAITQRLQELGRNDDYTAVSAALAYLHRMDRVHSVARGQWVLGSKPSPADDRDDGDDLAAAREGGSS